MSSTRTFGIEDFKTRYLICNAYFTSLYLLVHYKTVDLLLFLLTIKNWHHGENVTYSSRCVVQEM